MIKLSEKDMLNLEISSKLVLLCQVAKLWMQKKSSWRKVKVQLHQTYARYESEIALLLMWRLF